MKGGAWLTGGLDALARETGWDPASADAIVGTSAGSMIGALLRRRDAALVHGRPLDGRDLRGGRSTPRAARRPRPTAPAAPSFASHRGPPPIGPGSWRLALRSAEPPAPPHPGGACVSGWLPRGIVSTEPLRDQIRRVVPSGWAPHPGLWVVACDYATGRRVAVRPRGAPAGRARRRRRRLLRDPRLLPPGRDRRPPLRRRRHLLDLEPRRPARRGPRPGHLPQPDLLPAPDRARWNPLERRCGSSLRRASGRRLGSEAKKLRAAGTEVVLIQPTRRGPRR